MTKYLPSIVALVVILLTCSAHANIESIIGKYYESLPVTATHQERSATPQRAQHEHEHEHVHGYNCIHDKMLHKQDQRNQQRKQTLQLKPSEHHTQKRQQQQFEPMRFLVNSSFVSVGGATDPRACRVVGQQVPLYFFNVSSDLPYTCTEEDVLSDELMNLITSNVLPPIIEIFQALLSIRRESALRLDSQVFEIFGGECDVDVPIPSFYLDPGVEGGDYLVFVTARPVDTPDTVAYAGACNFPIVSEEPLRFGRPLAGIINFNPRHFQQFLEAASPFQFRRVIRVGIHELTHALGFSSTFYSSYVNPISQQPYPAAATIQQRSGTSVAGAPFVVNVTKIVTPNVISFSQDHFACTSVDGIELEDIGGAGTAGSHWEARVTGNEYMTGFVNPLMPVSTLTLSLLSDMGWYLVDFSLAEYWGWGRGLGCGFLDPQCSSSWPQFPGYWCERQTRGCSPDRTAKGECALFQYSQILPPQFQHFPQPDVGGGNAAADFCPYTEANPNQFCIDASQVGNTAIGEVFGPDSLCWEFAPDPNELSGAPGLACFPHRCVNESVLQVNVQGTWFTCPDEGGEVNVTPFLDNGFVNCPHSFLLCQNAARVGVRARQPGTSTATTTTSAVLLPLLLTMLVAIAHQFY